MIRIARDVTIAIAILLIGVLSAQATQGASGHRGTGDLGIIIERASGSVLIFSAGEHRSLNRVEGLGDLSHASAVFSPDQKFAYVFGRDGGLSKIDLLEAKIAKRIIQAGNSIGGAISDDGALVAVANYEPGGIRVFDSGSLEEIANIPSVSDGKASKALGLEDVPGRKFLFSLWDAGETWIADFSSGNVPALTKLKIGDRPYDALVSPDGRYYIAGLFGEDRLSVIDLWRTPLMAQDLLKGYRGGQHELPVYKMPHLEGWAVAGDRVVLPAIGRHELLWADIHTLKETGRTSVHSQPVFAVARPDGRQVWVNFAHPDNDMIQVVDAVTATVIREWKAGPAVLHIEFSPRGHEAWVSVRDLNKVQIYDAHTFKMKAEFDARSPSGIFMAARAHRTGF
ncbi:MAG: cytochrome D1 domain-containing protein [Hyphomicrobium sp.]